MSRSKILFLAIICLVILAVAFAMKQGVMKSDKPQSAAIGQDSKPALTVTTVQPETRIWPEQITATGTVQAWQESIIGPEIGGLGLAGGMGDGGGLGKKREPLARLPP